MPGSNSPMARLVMVGHYLPYGVDVEKQEALEE